MREALPGRAGWACAWRAIITETIHRGSLRAAAGTSQ